MEGIVARNPNMDACEYAALLQPFSLCADWLNQSRVQGSIEPIVERANIYVRELSEEDFKLKVTALEFSTPKYVDSTASTSQIVEIRCPKSSFFNPRHNRSNRLAEVARFFLSIVAGCCRNVTPQKSIWARTGDSGEKLKQSPHSLSLMVDIRWSPLRPTGPMARISRRIRVSFDCTCVLPFFRDAYRQLRNYAFYVRVIRD